MSRRQSNLKKNKVVKAFVDETKPVITILLIQSSYHHTKLWVTPCMNVKIGVLLPACTHLFRPTLILYYTTSAFTSFVTSTLRKAPLTV